MIRQISSRFSSTIRRNGDDSSSVSSAHTTRPREVESVDDSTGRDLLEKTVRERDASISALEKVSAEKEQTLSSLRKELQEERLLQMQDAILHRLEYERLQRQTQHMEERLKALEKDMHDKDAVHQYANLIKSVAPKSGVDSTYVMKLQSQLAKAVKKMDATSNQITLVEKSCHEVVSSLKTEISEIVEDRCRTELELRQQLEVLEDQKADMERQYEQQILKNESAMNRLKSARGSSGKEESYESSMQSIEASISALQAEIQAQKDERASAEVALRAQMAKAAEKLELLGRTSQEQNETLDTLQTSLSHAQGQHQP
mmetsp:Transcript_14854/g.22619  ORF Transcript_14854/g.22619 Transcript_14854/m.22619 type:complete len:316 (-) Transcript_14854:2798-3745(-)